MRLLKYFIIALLAIQLIACAATTVYFPKDEAAEMADIIIEDVHGQSPSSSNTHDHDDFHDDPALVYIANLLIPAAHADERLHIEDPRIVAIRQSMKQRFTQLEHYLDNGALGLTNQGLLGYHEIKAIGLREREQVNRLVTAENKDREDLYRLLATLNGNPKWMQRFRETFSERWIEHAQTGWWYQDEDGIWNQK